MRSASIRGEVEPGTWTSVKSSASGNIPAISSSTRSPPRRPVSQSWTRTTFTRPKLAGARAARAAAAGLAPGGPECYVPARMDSTWPNLVARRVLLRVLVVSQLRSATAESRLGWLWWLIDPLIMMLIYWGIVVGIFGRGGHYKPYPVFVLCALLPSKHFQSALASAAKLLRLNEGVIKAIPFPTMVLPLADVLAGLAYFVAGLVVLLLAALAWGCPLGGALVQLPALMAAQLLLVTSCSLVATSFGALIRDLSGFLTHITRVLFYFCPTLYGLDMILDRAQHLHGRLGAWLPTLYMLNPFAILIEGYRQAIFYGAFLAPHHWAVLAVECVAMFAIGQRVYRYYDRRVIKFL